MEKKDKTLEQIYQKKTQLEHILLRPDTYIGSVEVQNEKMWVYNKEKQCLEFREVKFVPGLFKIFDEILVNAADNYQRDKSMSYIKVTIDQKNNRISVTNNGKGIPIQIHREYGIYIPELIFGNLLTSSNYDDTTKKVVGGRNGYGAKLANIFSKVFIVETADSENKKYYKQVFRNNMTNKCNPEISEYKKEDFTCITFEPDLKHFRMDKLDDEIISLLTKRVYDMAGITVSKVKVYLNDELINIKNFSSYVDFYLNSSSKEEEREIQKVFEKPHERWEVAVALSEGQFQQVSYVNAIATSKGGTHVNYVADIVISHVMEAIKKKNKKIQVKPHQIKQHLWIFVNCLIDNPTFDSQTKETMTLKKDSFGSSFDLTEKFLKEFLKTGIVDHCLSFAKTREDLKLTRQLNAGVKKTGRLLGIPKLEDANKAGTKYSNECILILTEGDSAKSLAMAGIEIVGRDNYGVFPLKGKLLNVREASSSSILKNDEIQNLMKIIGLNTTKQYEDVKSLRYGSIMIMTDQDHDGSHIKGLIINFIHFFWPSLIRLNGFLKEFITPIIKVTSTNGKTQHSFYTIPEYKNWVESLPQGTLKNWKIKYYKGLGTSTDKEAQEYFNDIERNRIFFEYEDQVDEQAIDLAFNKKKTEDRKIWLANYNPESDFQESNYSKITYRDFINKEFILFSMSDNLRSIPSICDGLKPSERKILFSCFKRKLKDEIKVAQLVGYVSEHSAYHHGEASLAGTIVAMAQNYVGSNNINLLLPLGQFGTRNQGGKDHASPRYIFTNLNKVTRNLFNPNDDSLMNYIVEEGQKIEPNYYLPIIPMILVNGAEGIGTGWSTNIPCFNPREIVTNLKNRITKGSFFEMKPWYKNYSGEIIKSEKQDKISYTISGVWEWINDRTVKITEIPIKMWTRNFKENLEKLMGISTDKKSKEKEKTKKGKKKDDDDDDEEKEKLKPIISDFKEYHTNNKVHFEVTFLEDYADTYRDNQEKFIKKLKLQSSMTLTNMVLFNSEGKLCRYNAVNDIMEEFYRIRLTYYSKRKEYLIKNLKRELEILENKVRFILAVTSEPPQLKINKVKKKDILLELLKQKYTPMSKMALLEENEDKKSKKNVPSLDAEINKNDQEQDVDEVDESSLPIPSKEFDYLLSMPLWSLSQEKVNSLLKQKEEKKNEIAVLEKMRVEDIWINDIEEFLNILDEVEAKEAEERENNNKLKKKRGQSKPKKAKEAKDKNKNKAQETENEAKDKDKKKKEINNIQKQKSTQPEAKGQLNIKNIFDAQSDKKKPEEESKPTVEELFKMSLAERIKFKSKMKNKDNNDENSFASVELKLNENFSLHDKDQRRRLDDYDDIDNILNFKPEPKFIENNIINNKNRVGFENAKANDNKLNKLKILADDNDSDSDKEVSTNLDDKNYKF